jgi:hypothetical protein
VALRKSRRVHASDEGVTFSYKDYRQHAKSRERTLSIAEFAGRLRQHLLPAGFVRLRPYGLLANRGRDEKLQRCRRRLCLAGRRQRPGAAVAPGRHAPGQRRCAVCGVGKREVVERRAAWPKGGGAAGPNRW